MAMCVTSDDIIITHDEAVSASSWTWGGREFEDHYQEKATTRAALNDDAYWGVDWAKYGAPAVASSASLTYAPGSQTPQDSKQLNNHKKKDAWRRGRRKHLPKWMRR